MIAEFPMPKARGREGDETERVHERVHATIPEAQTRGALIVDDDRGRDGVQAVFTDQAVVAQRFDAQEAPVGGKADLPQRGQIAERTTDTEIVGVIDGGFGAKGLTFFVVLLDLGLFVLHVERRDDPVRQDAGAEASRGAARDAPVEDQLHLIGAADVEILPDDLFEETAPRERAIEDLGQGELRLQDRELVPIARGPVRRGERMRESAQPFAEDGLDLGGVERIGDPLHAGGFVTRADPIVQRLERHLPLRQLAL